MIKPAKIQVRFADLDVLGHVNNGVYLSYFEMARVHYFGQLLGKEWDWNKYGVILVKNEVEYIRPILLTDQPEVIIRCDEIGNKSFSLSYRILVNDQLYSKGSSTLVCFDAEKNHTIDIPAEMRDALEKLKGTIFE